MSTISVADTNAKLFRFLEILQQIRSENLEPKDFWPQYLEALRIAIAAEAGLVAVRGLQEDSSWQVICFAPASYRSHPFAKILVGKLDAAAAACCGEEGALLDLKWVGVRLKAGAGSQLCLALFSLGEVQPSHAHESVEILRLLSDLPAHYQLSRSALEEMARSEQFAGILDLMALINAQERFLSAAMTFCNELASRHQCERVSLGWLKKGYMRIQAISHVDDFDKKMDAIQELELAMEEAFDQDAEIVLPPSTDNKSISRDHESFARAQQVDHVCSMPLRMKGEPIAVCTFERNGTPFGEKDLRLLRLGCDQAVRRLADLKEHDRWFGARLAAYVKKKLGALVGYKHTWAKGLAIFLFLLLAFLCFVPVTYRLRSPVMLRTEDVTFLTAPFDGYIEQVHARVGDELAQGDALLTMDQSDLLLEEAALLAEKNRNQREFEKARAEQALAEMRIAGALQEQAGARLDLVRYRLGQAVLKAPYAGIVVEGDQRERVGAPVTRGEVLFRVGKIDRLFAELEVQESQIHHVNTSLDGEIALASRPQDTFPIQVVRIEPSAVVKEAGNVFLVRCEFPEGFPSWWKPGMTGVAKLNAGKRTWLWIFTHRTVDFLRLRLWW